MTGFRRCDGSGNGFQVSHLSYQDHIRVLTESGSQCLSIVCGIAADLPLVYHGFVMSVEVFNRILQSDDVVRIGPVDHMDQGSQCGGFTAAGRSCNQYQATFSAGHFHNLSGDSQILRLRNIERQASHNCCQCTSLLKNVHTKTAYPGNGVGKVCLSGFL